ncbi:MAG: ATP-dependent Clp protease proteolytic subunit [Roseburia sp.]|nr:ATP-dependent Clp protease proteolytic subunit [Anaeroplasma bactoclasticum]MCM1195465.1 ATP-dependent Clp protease proteolytic subunit [Roseburia sp.]MCM1555943.1 ATP-dependent Clp protease proteolytic subunit [Anaeroplasma bactoclasticum]
MNYIPYVLEKGSHGERSFDIYSRLLQDRIVLLVGEIDDHMSSILISQLLYLDSVSHEDIDIYISSPGGSITAGLAVFDTIRHIQSKVNTIVVGMAASMAAFLLASGTGTRYALPHAEVMIHQPYGGMQGVVSDIDIQAKRLLKTKALMNQLLAELCNQSLEKIAHDTERDYYMSSQEALEYHIIDEILS